MKEFKVYTTAYCPYCVRAKELLKSKNIEFEEINLEGKDDERVALMKKTGMRTVPQIFKGEELIGGYTELAEMDKKGLI